MPERSQHRVSDSPEGESERPATGAGRPRTAAGTSWKPSVGGRPGGARPAVYQTVLPPLTAIVWPVTKAASSLARYAAAQPTSSGLPQWPIGIVDR